MWHMAKMELVLRRMDNDAIDLEELSSAKESIECAGTADGNSSRSWWREAVDLATRKNQRFSLLRTCEVYMSPDTDCSKLHNAVSICPTSAHQLSPHKAL